MQHMWQYTRPGVSSQNLRAANPQLKVLCVAAGIALCSQDKENLFWSMFSLDDQSVSCNAGLLLFSPRRLRCNRAHFHGSKYMRKCCPGCLFTWSTCQLLRIRHALWSVQAGIFDSIMKGAALLGQAPWTVHADAVKHRRFFSVKGVYCNTSPSERLNLIFRYSLQPLRVLLCLHHCGQHA